MDDALNNPTASALAAYNAATAPDDEPSDSSPSLHARYDAACAPDGWLSVFGWLRLASEMECEAERAFRSDGPSFLIIQARAVRLYDRADDCRSRAARLTRGAS